MLKRYLSNIIRYVILPISGWVFSLSFAHADAVAGNNVVKFLGFGLNDLLAEIAAWISSMAITVMSIWVTLTGALLNVSITLTLRIKDFVDSTQGVYIVWQTIRDVSGMFIIFMLLYASFKIILSRDGSVSGVGSLIKNVVIVGVLINFSFFITSLLIDASNIASLTLYRSIVENSSSTPAIVDAQTAKDCQSSSGHGIGKVNTCIITSQMFNGIDGGISDIFLTYLNPQSIYSNANPTSPNSASDAKPLEILIQGIVGTIIMFTIGLSFFIASLAFIVRFIVLILLLAFSPIWFASWVIPQLADRAKDFTKQLNAQLIFMPVYLLLLYAALRILTASTVFTNPSGNAFSGSGASLTFIPLNYVVLAINDFFIIFLLNIPLVTAMSMGGVASDWINTDKFGAKGMWKNIGAGVGRNTGGRLAHIANNSGVMKNISARAPLVGNIVSKQLDKAANFGFGQKKGGFKDRTDALAKDFTKQYDTVGKASAAEKARYDHTDKTRDASGKTDLDRFLQKRKDTHFENISKPTILSRIVNKASNTAKGVSDKLAPGAVSAEAFDAVKQNISSSFSTSENAAMMEIKKKRDADKTEAESKAAASELAAEQKKFDQTATEHAANLKKLDEKLEGLTRAVKDAEEAAAKRLEAIEVTRAQTGVDPKTITRMNEVLASSIKYTDALKIQKAETEKERKETIDSFDAIKKSFTEKKGELNKKIKKGDDLKQKKFEEQIAGKLDSLEGKIGGSGGGGGGGGEKLKKDESKH
ncbi:MAG TPA: hypothetical protein VL335_00295 [Candidatus Paceibacterota bacterium]|jgi:hypothetical protein|nr:hypothetical protein [Candidatus Paceibacterota bacterium]